MNKCIIILEINDRNIRIDKNNKTNQDMKNKKVTILALSSIAILCGINYAKYEVIIGTMEVRFKGSEWLEIEPKALGWTDAPKESELYRYDCSKYTPLPEDEMINVTFTQTANDCKGVQYQSYIKQEKNSVTGEIRTKGSAYNDENDFKVLTGLTNTREAIGTASSYLMIVNPIAGKSGIYDISDGQGNTAKAYVDMNNAGGNWILIGRWVQLPSGSTKRNFKDVAMRSGKILSYTNDTMNYPVLPSGSLNLSSTMMVKNANPTWVSMFGGWQTFSTFAQDQNIGAGFSVNTPNGVSKLYAEAAGWPGQRPTDMSDTFGLWPVAGNGGPCGGVNAAGSNRICPSFSYATAPHFDTTSLKEVYVKSKN